MIRMQRLAGATGVLCLTLGPTLTAQGRDDGSNARLLSTLAIEVRELRAELQTLGRRQLETAVASALVVAQYGRVQRLDRQVDDAQREQQMLSARLELIDRDLDALRVERDGPVAAARRTAIDAALDRLTREQAGVFDRQQAAERRIAQLTRTRDDEQQRWDAAVDRLAALAHP
jgi:hypothetical protein